MDWFNYAMGAAFGFGVGAVVTRQIIFNAMRKADNEMEAALARNR